MTQRQVAAALGFKHPSTIKNYERGRIPEAAILLKLAATLNSSMDWILTGKRGGQLAVAVAEQPEVYMDAKRARLIREVKALVHDADDDVIDALLKNVEIFKKVPKS